METLNAARRDSRVIKDFIKTKTKDFESAEREASELQRTLTSLSTRLEKRKASLGMSTSLSAYLQLNEPIAEDQEEDELLRPGDAYCGCGGGGGGGGGSGGVKFQPLSLGQNDNEVDNEDDIEDNEGDNEDHNEDNNEDHNEDYDEDNDVDDKIMRIIKRVITRG